MTDLSSQSSDLPREKTLLGYIRAFSSTERAIFWVFILVALVSALIMGKWVNDYFSVEIPAYGGTLHEGLIGLPRTINPILAVTDVDRDISALVYSGLAKYINGKLVTDLAQTYEISDDGLTYSFTLKPKLHFHDGTPLTTEDVAFTIQMIQNPAIKSPRRVDWADIAVKVVSATEIQFILKQPYSPFLSNTTIGILPKHIWSSVGDEQFIFSQYNLEPIGSGPYKFDGISRNKGGIPTRYSLTSSNSYYGKKPYLEDIVFTFFEDEASGLASLDQGTIDSLSAISPNAAKALSRDIAQAYTVTSASLPRMFGVFLNQNESPILADKVIRRALDMSIDRKALIEAVLYGYGSPIDGPVPALETKPATTTVSATSTLVAASLLLEKNGWKKSSDGTYSKKTAKSASTTITFDIYTADTPDLKKAAEFVSNTWNSLGANVTVKVYETNDLYQNIIRTRKYDALLFGESIGKDRDLYAFWHSSQRNAPGLNVSLYTNSKVDKLLEEIRSTSNETVRATKYNLFDQQIRTDIPAIFLYMPDYIYAIPRTLRNIKLSSLVLPSDRWNGVRDWYIETENVWRIFNN